MYCHIGCLVFVSNCIYKSMEINKDLRHNEKSEGRLFLLEMLELRMAFC